MSPTPPALALLKQAEAIEAGVLSFVRSAAGNANDMAGNVRITASTLIGIETLPELIVPLLEAHHGLNVEIDATDEVEDLLRREADVAIRLVKPKQEALLVKRMKPIEIGFFATREYVAQYGAPQTYDVLQQDHAFVGDDRNRVLAAAVTARGLPLPQNICVRSDSILVQLAAVRAGAAIGIMQAQIGKKYGLIRVLPDFAATLDCWVVMHEDLRSVRRIRLVFEHLVAKLT